MSSLIHHSKHKLRYFCQSYIIIIIISWRFSLTFTFWEYITLFPGRLGLLVVKEV